MKLHELRPAEGTTKAKKITLEEAMQMGESLPEEAETADITGMRGSQIDFTA